MQNAYGAQIQYKSCFIPLPSKLSLSITYRLIVLILLTFFQMIGFYDLLARNKAGIEVLPLAIAYLAHFCNQFN